MGSGVVTRGYLRLAAPRLTAGNCFASPVAPAAAAHCLLAFPAMCAAAAGAIAYGLASILLLTPLLGLAAVQLPLQPPALAVGLGVFCCMPTALSSGVTFTQVPCPC